MSIEGEELPSPYFLNSVPPKSEVTSSNLAVNFVPGNTPPCLSSEEPLSEIITIPANNTQLLENEQVTAEQHNSLPITKSEKCLMRKKHVSFAIIEEVEENHHVSPRKASLKNILQPHQHTAHLAHSPHSPLENTQQESHQHRHVGFKEDNNNNSSDNIAEYGYNELYNDDERILREVKRLEEEERKKGENLKDLENSTGDNTMKRDNDESASFRQKKPSEFNNLKISIPRAGSSKKITSPRLARNNSYTKRKGGISSPRIHPHHYHDSMSVKTEVLSAVTPTTVDTQDFEENHLEDAELSGCLRLKSLLKHTFDFRLQHHHAGVDDVHLTQFQRFRKGLAHILESFPVQVVILLLLVLDIGVVAGELIMDFTFPIHDDHHDEASLYDVAHETMHIISLTVLGLFIVEIGFKFFAFGWRFFTKFWFVLDAFVVIASFILEIILKGLSRDVAGLLIFGRVWRALRIVYGVAYSVEIEMGTKLRKEKERRRLQKKKYRQEISDLRHELEHERVLKARALALVDDLDMSLIPGSEDVPHEAPRDVNGNIVATTSGSPIPTPLKPQKSSKILNLQVEEEEEEEDNEEEDIHPNNEDEEIQVELSKLEVKKVKDAIHRIRENLI